MKKGLVMIYRNVVIVNFVYELSDLIIIILVYRELYVKKFVIMGI